MFAREMKKQDLRQKLNYPLDQLVNENLVNWRQLFL